MKKLLTVLLCLGLVGCASTGIIKISPDTYMISKERWGLSTVGIKADVFKQANAFASSQGKVMIPLTFNERQVAFGQYPTVELQFRLVDKDAPEAKGAYLTKSPDVVIKSDDTLKSNVDVHSEGSDQSSDLYTELTKLDDLRKKGILTEDEFQAQKKILLEKQQ
jgi:hypothetical protein